MFWLYIKECKLVHKAILTNTFFRAVSIQVIGSEFFLGWAIRFRCLVTLTHRFSSLTFSFTLTSPHTRT